MTPRNSDDDFDDFEDFDDDFDDDFAAEDSAGDPYDNNPYADDSPDLIDCPVCGAEIHEDSLQCPRCGDYLTADTSHWSGRSWWWTALGLLGILAVLLGLAFNF